MPVRTSRTSVLTNCRSDPLGGEPFDEKMQRLAAQLREQQAEAAKLDATIAANLKELGYGG